MLRSEHKHTALEDIFQELLTTSNRPTTRLLAEFVQRYPDFANEILSFASEWALQESMGESELAHEIDEKLSQAKAHSALEDALFRFDRNTASETGHNGEPVVGKADDLKSRSKKRTLASCTATCSTSSKTRSTVPSFSASSFVCSHRR